MAGPTLVRATPHQIVYAVPTGNAATIDIAYATLLADSVTGPLKTALVAAQGQTPAQADAKACLLTGSLALSSLSSGFSDIESIFSCDNAAAGIVTAVSADVDGVTANSPKIVLIQNAANSDGGFLYITHRWSPTV